MVIFFLFNILKMKFLVLMSKLEVVHLKSIFASESMLLIKEIFCICPEESDRFEIIMSKFNSVFSLNKLNSYTTSAISLSDTLF